MMTRKAAILSMLMAPFAGRMSAQKPKDWVLSGPITSTGDILPFQLILPKDGSIQVDKSHPPEISIGFSVEYHDEFENVDSVEKYMLEVKADGRVARFTAKEVMDALGGVWDKDVK